MNRVNNNRDAATINEIKRLKREMKEFPDLRTIYNERIGELEARLEYNPSTRYPTEYSCLYQPFTSPHLPSYPIKTISPDYTINVFFTEIWNTKIVDSNGPYITKEIRDNIRRAYDMTTSLMARQSLTANPSYFYHSFILFLYILDHHIENANIEDNSIIGSPDIWYKDQDSKIVIVEITTESQFHNKREKYKAHCDNIILIDKYQYIKGRMIDENIQSILTLSYICEHDSCLENLYKYHRDQLLKQTLRPITDGVYGLECLQTLNNLDTTLIENNYNCIKEAFCQLLRNPKSSANLEMPIIKYKLSSFIDNYLQDFEITSNYFEAIPNNPYYTEADIIRYEKRDAEEFDIRPTVTGDILHSVDEVSEPYKELVNDEKNRYQKSSYMPVDIRMIDAMVKPIQLLQRDDYEVAFCKRLNSCSNYLQQESVFKDVFFQRAFDVRPGLDGYYIEHISKIPPIDMFTPQHSVFSLKKDIKYNRFFQSKVPIDADDYKIIKNLILTESERIKILNFLETFKPYHQLKVYESIANALYMIRNTRHSYKVRTHLSKSLNIYAYVKISGLLFKTDRGIATVSIMQNESLLKTFKWRLSDVSNYKVNCSRFLALFLGLELFKESPRVMGNISTIYAQILIENSWGLSKLLKIFKYLSIGYLMENPLLADQVDKLLKELEENKPIYTRKVSVYYILKLIKKTVSSKDKEKSLLFGLPVKDIGKELFLANLCPKDTYGKERHRANIMDEIHAEISLFNNSRPIIVSETEEALEIIKSPTVEKWLNFLRKIHYHSSQREWRFSGSLVIPFIVYHYLHTLIETNPNLFTKTNPMFSDLLTQKSSFSSLTSQKGNACDTISELSSHLKTTSSTAIASRILAKTNAIDFSFRVFDKDQIGGDREISIMSSEMRILQSIVEGCSRNIGYLSNIDMLDNPNKFDLLLEAMTKASDAKQSLYFTCDQTRWGPNWNTGIFAMVYCLLSKLSLEFKLPTLILMLSQFKIFEALPLANSFDYADTFYSIPGMMAESHMGQGIFHFTSSFIHSFLTKFYLDVCIENVIKKTTVSSHKLLDIDSQIFITSDDCAIIVSINPSPYVSMFSRSAVNEAVGYFKRLWSLPTSNVYTYLGIKSSDYKSSVTTNDNKYLEFNSLYIIDKGYIRNSMKFLSSYIDGRTRADLVDDIKHSFSTYGDSLNNGCTAKESMVISWINLRLTCRTWGLPFIHLKLPSEYVLLECVLFNSATLDDSESFEHKPVLHFKKREQLEKSLAQLSLTNSMDQEILKAKAKLLLGTKVRDKETSGTKYIPKNARERYTIKASGTCEGFTFSRASLYICMQALCKYGVVHIDDVFLESIESQFSNISKVERWTHVGYSIMNVRTVNRPRISLHDLIYQYVKDKPQYKDYEILLRNPNRPNVTLKGNFDTLESFIEAAQKEMERWRMQMGGIKQYTYSETRTQYMQSIIHSLINVEMTRPDVSWYSYSIPLTAHMSSPYLVTCTLSDNQLHYTQNDFFGTEYATPTLIRIDLTDDLIRESFEEYLINDEKIYPNLKFYLVWKSRASDTLLSIEEDKTQDVIDTTNDWLMEVMNMDLDINNLVLTDEIPELEMDIDLDVIPADIEKYGDDEPNFEESLKLRLDNENQHWDARDRDKLLNALKAFEEMYQKREVCYYCEITRREYLLLDKRTRYKMFHNNVFFKFNKIYTQGAELENSEFRIDTRNLTFWDYMIQNIGTYSSNIDKIKSFRDELLNSFKENAEFSKPPDPMCFGYGIQGFDLTTELPNNAIKLSREDVAKRVVKDNTWLYDIIPEIQKMDINNLGGSDVDAVNFDEADNLDI